MARIGNHDLSGERWSSLARCEGYEFSSIGRVRSYWKFRVFSTGKNEKILSNSHKPIKATTGSNGVVNVKVSNWDGAWKRKTLIVSRVVLTLFGPEKPDGYICCHNNGDSTDNRIENLRWDTYSANTVDQVFHGSLNGLTVSPDTVPYIWELLVKGESSRKIAEKTGLPETTVSNIRIKRTFAYITDLLPGIPSRRRPIAEGSAIYIDRKFCDLDLECWAEVPGLPGYRISNFARVQCCRVYSGEGYRRQPGTPPVLGTEWAEVSKGITRYGYENIRPYVDRRRMDYFVHRLVLLAFVGPNPPGMIACHNDGNRTNNHASNLRWDTPSSNNKDRFLHQIQRSAENDPRN